MYFMYIVSTTVKSVWKGHIEDKECPSKTGDFLKDVQFVWDFSCQDKKKDI